MKLETPRIDLDYKPKTDILKRIDQATKKKETFLELALTPDECRDILAARNKRNRPISETRIQKYARKMREGKWRPIGSIHFDIDGFLIDGQHRLEAAAMANHTLVVDIKTGHDPEDMRVIDTGKPRTPGDYLGIKGYHHASTLAAAVRLIIYFKKESRVSGKISDDIADTVTIDEFLEDRVKEDLILKALEKTKSEYQKVKFLKGSQWAMLHYLTYEANSRKGPSFMHMLHKGDDLGPRKNSPIYHLRNELLQYTPGRARGGLRINTSDILTEKFKLIIKAWNAFVSEKQIGELTLSREEKSTPIIERMIDMKKAI